MFCKARLTKGASRIRIGTSKRYALKVYVCSNPSEDDLCCECKKKSRSAQKQNSRLHGLLTEPIPSDSHIYGGTWYMEQARRFGDPPAAWIASAQQHQSIAEQWVDGSVCIEVVRTGIEVARTGIQLVRTGIELARTIQEMPLKQTKLCPKKICMMYKESDKAVVTLPRDTYSITKGVVDGIPVWILPNGKLFDMDDQGEPRNLIVLKNEGSRD